MNKKKEAGVSWKTYLIEIFSFYKMIAELAILSFFFWHIIIAYVESAQKWG